MPREIRHTSVTSHGTVTVTQFASSDLGAESSREYSASPYLPWPAWPLPSDIARRSVSGLSNSATGRDFETWTVKGNLSGNHFLPCEIRHISVTSHGTVTASQFASSVPGVESNRECSASLLTVAVGHCVRVVVGSVEFGDGPWFRDTNRQRKSFRAGIILCRAKCDVTRHHNGQFASSVPGAESSREYSAISLDRRGWICRVWVSVRSVEFGDGPRRWSSKEISRWNHFLPRSRVKLGISHTAVTAP